jgi:hypothetical protein
MSCSARGKAPLAHIMQPPPPQARRGGAGLAEVGARSAAHRAGGDLVVSPTVIGILARIRMSCSWGFRTFGAVLTWAEMFGSAVIGASYVHRCDMTVLCA